MGVIRLTKSGSAVQFITDEGIVYQQGKVYLDNILRGNPNAVVQLTRLPYTVDPKQFGQSKVFEPDYVDMPDEGKKLMMANAMDKRVVQLRDEAKAYEDKKPW